ncbi:MAG: amidophosphoribosyltransferase [Nanoarchaeota archaeon]|nr:amidophosphoribosyltransferase [Nanoarchaeota archaeon]MBU1027998.1 amidophosphoribosyltransferase [Nanoarchaeota archaeon]
MSGIFGIVSDRNCVDDLFYGTDYQFHLGTKIGGMAVYDRKDIHYKIKSIGLYPFRPQLFNFKENVKARSGIGVVSDYEVQPFKIKSHLGNYALAHVGKIANLEKLALRELEKGKNFIENTEEEFNQVELIANLISQGKSFVEGIEIMQNEIKGSSSLMLLTKEGIYLARDKSGRTPIVVGRKLGSMAATSETTAFENLGFEFEKDLGPGEIGLLTNEVYRQLKEPRNKLQLCTFLPIYYGFPTSCYEGVNAEQIRYQFGEFLAQRDLDEGGFDVDFVFGIPDSGVGSGIGYSNKSGLPYERGFVKYTPTWGRSFMPQDQKIRDLVAEYKLIGNRRIIKNKKIIITEDSIVRGTQLKEKVRELFKHGATEVHARISCPPLTHACNFLNFSRSKSIMDLATRRAMKKVEGRDVFDITSYTDENSEKYGRMVEVIRMDLGLTSLKFQYFNDMVEAVGLPAENLCPGCWREVEA